MPSPCLGVTEAAVSARQIAENSPAVAAATGWTTRAMGDARSALDAVARMATALSAPGQDTSRTDPPPGSVVRESRAALLRMARPS